MVMCECGDPEEAHTATCFTPIYSSKACQYAHDSDNPCWCYKFQPATGHMVNPDGSLMTFISHGKLNDEQEAVVRVFVAGFNVHDIGAGQLGLARKLVELGAHTVTAIDRMYSYSKSDPLPDISLVGEYFEEYARHGHFIDVAFISWPEAYHSRGLVELIRPARVVIYLGTNFDGTSCGTEEMFQELSRRNVLALVPDRWNSLIVYGSEHVSRRLLPEEYAGMHREATGYFKYGDVIADL